jgi:hypothetical protein
VRLDDRGLTISLREAAFFASGDAAMQPSSLPTLERIAAVVADLPNSVRLEGHTDARPIHNSRYRSSWDLFDGPCDRDVGAAAEPLPHFERANGGCGIRGERFLGHECYGGGRASGA